MSYEFSRRAHEDLRAKRYVCALYAHMADPLKASLPLPNVYPLVPIDWELPVTNDGGANSSYMFLPPDPRDFVNP